jgi:hypothetical protein
VNSYGNNGPAPAAGEGTGGPEAITGSAAAERAVRDLRAAGRLAEAVRLVSQLGTYGVADGPDATTSLGAAVLEAYGDQLAATDPAAADAAYRNAAAEQRSFAAAATSGGEGIARMAEADRIDASGTAGPWTQPDVLHVVHGPIRRDY